MAVNVPREVLERALRNQPSSQQSGPKFGSFAWTMAGAQGSPTIRTSVPAVESTPEPTYLYIENESQIVSLTQNDNDSAYVIVDDLVTNFTVSFDTDLPFVSFKNTFDPTSFDNCRIEVTNYNDISATSYRIEPLTAYTGQTASVSALTTDEQDNVVLAETYTFSYFNTGSLIMGFTTGDATIDASVTSYPERTTLLEPSNFVLTPLNTIRGVSATWTAPVTSTTTGPISAYKLQSRHRISNTLWSSWRDEVAFISPTATSISFTCLSGGWTNLVNGSFVPFNSNQLSDPRIQELEYTDIYSLPAWLPQEFRIAAVSHTGVGQWTEPTNAYRTNSYARLVKQNFEILGGNEVLSGTFLGYANPNGGYCDPRYRTYYSDALSANVTSFEGQGDMLVYRVIAPGEGVGDGIAGVVAEIQSNDCETPPDNALTAGGELLLFEKEDLSRVSVMFPGEMLLFSPLSGQ